jgi:hypothetical protein
LSRRAGAGSGPVGTHKERNNEALPGVVTYFFPAGKVQITLPSRSCSSRYPQNVLSRWWHRLAERRFKATVVEGVDVLVNCCQRVSSLTPPVLSPRLLQQDRRWSMMAVMP